jgi:hypothetical protein
VLRQWLPQVEALADAADTVHVVFRNAVGDQAVRNAARMIELLAGAGLPVLSVRPAAEGEDEERQHRRQDNTGGENGGETVVQQRLPGT